MTLIKPVSYEHPLATFLIYFYSSKCLNNDLNLIGRDAAKSDIDFQSRAILRNVTGKIFRTICNFQGSFNIGNIFLV